MSDDSKRALTALTKILLPVSVTSPAFILAGTIAGAIVRFDFDEPNAYAFLIVATVALHVAGHVSIKRSHSLQMYLSKELKDMILNGSIVWVTVALTNSLLRLLPNTKQPSHIEFWQASLLTTTLTGIFLYLAMPLIRKYYGLPPQEKEKTTTLIS